MARLEPGLIALLRIGYAVAVLGVNFYMLAAYLGVAPAPVLPSAEGRAFMAALTAARFFDPLLFITYLTGGAALLIPRTAPLGILILAPPIVVIFFFHLVLTGMVVWAVAWAAGLAVLAWAYRDAFRPLVNFKARPSF